MYAVNGNSGWGALSDAYPVGDVAVTIPTTTLLYIGLIGFIGYKFFIAARNKR